MTPPPIPATSQPVLVVIEEPPAPVFTPPAYHYEEAWHGCRDRMSRSNRFIVALAISQVMRPPQIGAFFGVTAECINRRLRKGGLTRASGRPVKAI